jgi:hypothetical protein
VIPMDNAIGRGRDRYSHARVIPRARPATDGSYSAKADEQAPSYVGSSDNGSRRVAQISCRNDSIKAWVTNRVIAAE